MTPQNILDFWFGGKPDAEYQFWFGKDDDPDYGQYRSVWFQPDSAFISEVKDRFTDIHTRAAAGELDNWQKTPEGALALIILLDQMSNLIYRYEPAGFASDAKAIQITKKALENNFDKEFPEQFRWFFYLPLEHSENLIDQYTAVGLFTMLTDNETNASGLDYAKRHLRVIQRFGRFPNRNKGLGRKSTSEEEEFLAGPEAPF